MPYENGPTGGTGRRIKSSAAKTDEFYADLKCFDTFVQLTDFDRYQPLPDDWFIAIADVVQSTRAIEAGRYKAVNTVGAAVLVAITNALPALAFPMSSAATRPLSPFPAHMSMKSGMRWREPRPGRRIRSTWCCALPSFPSRTSARLATMSVLRVTPRQEMFHTPCSPAAALFGRKSS